MTRRRLAALLAPLAMGLAAAGAGRLEGQQIDPEAQFREAVELRRATRFDEARQAYEALRSWGRDHAEPTWEVSALLGLCDLERDTGNPAEAVATCNRALEQFEPGLEPSLEARIHRQRAQARAAAKDRDGAKHDLEEAARIYSELGMDLEVAGVDATRSVIATWEGAWEDAVRYGSSSFPVLLEHREMAEAVGALSGVAYGLQKLGRHEEAVDAYDRLVDLAWERGDQQVLNFAFCNRATVRWALGEEHESEEDLRRAIAGLEETRRRIPSGSQSRQDYFAAQHSAYDDLISLLAKTYRGVEAFDIAERFHARSFLELLDDRALDRAAAGSELGRRERELVEALGAVRLDVEREPTAAGRAEVARLQTELSAVRSEIRRAQPRYAELTEPEPPTGTEVQASLAPGEALVAYWVGTEQSYAWAITQEKIRFALIPVGRDALRKATLAYLAPLRSAELARDRALKKTESEHIEIGNRLYRWLIGSLPGKVRNLERLVFVRDDFLHYLPFEALIEGCDEASRSSSESKPIHAAYRRCRFLGLEKAISYAPSAGISRKLRQARKTGTGDASKALAMAPFADAGPPAEISRRTKGRGSASLGPLRFSGLEIERVTSAIPGSTAHLGDEATESRFKTLAPAFGTLHLATHGLVSDSLPMTSAVVLRADDRDDGLLHAEEVLGLELDADLVTLSACRTGRGALHRGEGILGLSRSFLYAGARSVVVSMWDVDDRPTPDLMGSFYQQLSTGLGAAEALLRARREQFEDTGRAQFVLREREVAYAHPRFWAAFVVNGN